MGYEIKFIVGIRNNNWHETIEGDKYCYVDPIAIYNYSKDYDLRTFIDNNSGDSECFTFVENKENHIIKDCYGEKLKEININKLLEYLNNNVDNYRRYLPLKMMLQGFEKESEKFNNNYENLVVLSYGY